MQRIRIILLTIFLVMTCALSAEVLHIVLQDESGQLPKKFRTTNDPLGCSWSCPSKKGLRTLQASGSAQFSEKEFHNLIKKLNFPSPLLIVDLRDEQHGFINGHAVTWTGSENILPKLEMGSIITLEKSSNKKATHLIVKKTESEEELTHRYGADYLHIPVIDGALPTEKEMEKFFEAMSQIKPNTWIHFHCAQGRGRTTLFMAIYDIMHNAHQVSFNDIIARQYLLGGIKLDQSRRDFLKLYYDNYRSHYLGKQQFLRWGQACKFACFGAHY